MKAAGVLGFAIALLVAEGAHAAGDAAKGKLVFAQCVACHSIAAGHNGIGPTLHGLLGRKAGAVPDFRYSPAMKRSGLVWNEGTLKIYLVDPAAKVPGTKMTFLGIQDPRRIDDLIAYLKDATR